MVDGVARPETCAVATWSQTPPQEVCDLGGCVAGAVFDTGYVTPAPYAG